MSAKSCPSELIKENARKERAQPKGGLSQQGVDEHSTKSRCTERGHVQEKGGGATRWQPKRKAEEVKANGHTDAAR